MNEHKSLLTRLSETFDQWRAERRAAAREAGPVEHRGWLRRLARHLTPNLGTIIAVAALLLAFPSIAAPLRAPSAPSACLISYQGRLADAEGNPITGKVNIEFRLYDVPTGGLPLWEEFWTGGNAVDVSDGLFSVMLGSINDTLCSAIEGRDELYLGITVGTDSEMEPRVQLGSVPFSMQALTVPDGSITTGKIAIDAITTTHIIDGAVTADKLAGRSSGLIQTWVDDSVQSFDATGSGSERISFDTGIDVTVPSGHTEYYLVIYQGIFGYDYEDRTGTQDKFHGQWRAKLVDGATEIGTTWIVHTGYRARWDAVGNGYWRQPYIAVWLVELDGGVHSLDVAIYGYSDYTMDMARVDYQKLTVIPLP